MASVAEFTDINQADPMFRPFITALRKAEIVTGRAGGFFDPKASITREEFAAMLWRAIHWPKLIADELRDVSVHIFTTMGKVGSGWWVGPQDILTARHVLVEIDAAGEMWVPDYRIMLKGVAGLIRADWQSERPHPIWTTPEVDPVDVGILRVPVGTYQAYLAMREQQGLGEQSFWRFPAPLAEPEEGDPVAVIGSPLGWEATINEGRVTQSHVPHLIADGVYNDFVSVSAGINPGNSGGLVVGFDRGIIGMADLKPWLNSAFGYSQADDQGMCIRAADIVGWCRRRGVEVQAAAN